MIPSSFFAALFSATIGSPAEKPPPSSPPSVSVPRAPQPAPSGIARTCEAEIDGRGLAGARRRTRIQSCMKEHRDLCRVAAKDQGVAASAVGPFVQRCLANSS